MVQSSKSWLCNPRVDRTSRFLPWQSNLVGNKISPVAAAGLLLEHIISAWNHHFAADDSSGEFAKQRVVVTVPASFDPVARTLPSRAIEGAGAENFSLLEEPLAAFYEYLHRNDDRINNVFCNLKNALVIDIGGGTTDFSIVGIDASKKSGEVLFKRVAVGPHILVGGDNLDLAVARKIEASLQHRGKKTSYQTVADSASAKP
jgi:molecular chaperone DnaK (HSP70)